MYPELHKIHKSLKATHTKFPQRAQLAPISDTDQHLKQITGMFESIK